MDFEARRLWGAKMKDIARNRKYFAARLSVGVLALAILPLVVVPSVRWRAHLLFMTAAGEIPDIECRDLFSFLLPSSGQSVERIIETRNPYAIIHNPKFSAADVNAGAHLFGAQCASCHAPDGRGTPLAPALVGREFKHGASDWAIFRTIRYGVPNTVMASHPLPQNELWQEVAYIRSLERQGQSTTSASPIGALFSPVSYEELRSAHEPSNDWLTYSGSYASTRHSTLTQIGPSNADELAVRWIHQFPAMPDIRIESSPIVRHGVMFVTSPPGRVIALDAGNGNLLWEYDRKHPQTGCEHCPVNRGVAVLDDRVFVATSDAKLTALSAQTGTPVWETAVANNVVANNEQAYGITSAPLAYRDLIVTGVNTTVGGRGFIAAFDANTGKERWRFYTIPAPGEVGSSSWAGDSWRNGGAPTWLTGSYDPTQDLLYWGVGNPKPDYEVASRKGDNLYSNSVVALRGSTGELVWYFQFTPADDHDWDSAQIPVLADYETGKGTDKRLLWASRNGFYYVLDRESGRFLKAVPFAQQTWADGIDERGRPIRRVQTSPNHKGVLVYPGTGGATNWWSPSFDSALNYMFVPVLEEGMVYFPSESTDGGDPAVNSSPSSSGRPLYTAVRALNGSTGKLIWEYRRHPRFVDDEMGGILSTKSGVVFAGDQRTFFALDSRTGNMLWSFAAGGNIAAAPVTYISGGEQFVAIAAGSDLMAFALPKTRQKT
jgi:alcohol dehydrogenase (cytochrome c)